MSSLLNFLLEVFQNVACYNDVIFFHEAVEMLQHPTKTVQFPQGLLDGLSLTLAKHVRKGKREDTSLMSAASAGR